MHETYKNFYPVCFLSEESLLLFKKGVFYSLDIKISELKEVARIKTGFLERLIYAVPILNRVFRFGIRCGIKLTDSIVVFVLRGGVYELDLDSGTISNGYFTSDGSRPLAFTNINNITGFDDGVYFGGYLGNENKEPVSVYRRIDVDNWSIVYEFGKGQIEHIHNIIADEHHGYVFILTGDHEQAAAIWLAEDNFSNVVPILSGDQKYRACVAFPTQEGLIYATDSPYTKNSIRVLTKAANGDWTSKFIRSINGPAIYGCVWRDEFVFSTSVEGDGRDQGVLYKLLGKKLGSGVLSDYVFVYRGNLRHKFTEIYKEKKDMYPFFLFQFGVLTFPSGMNWTATLPVFHIGTREHSMDTLLIKSDDANASSRSSVR